MEENWLNKDLATTLFISNSEISESLNRSMIAKLISSDKRKVARNSLFELLVYGLKYIFPAEIGTISRGVPTGHSAPILKDAFVFDENYVWPTPAGKTKGYVVQPLYPNQPLAALADPALYDKLALVDAIRVGKNRERNKAIELLKELIIVSNAPEYHQAQSR